jgi:hypothetical protein
LSRLFPHSPLARLQMTRHLSKTARVSS